MRIHSVVTDRGAGLRHYTFRGTVYSVIIDSENSRKSERLAARLASEGQPGWAVGEHFVLFSSKQKTSILRNRTRGAIDDQLDALIRRTG